MKANSQRKLDSRKLVLNFSFRQLSPQEEDVLALGLSFAVAPRQVPVQEIVAATEALAHNLDQTSADLLRLQVSGVLHQTKPPKPNLTPLQKQALCTLREDPNIVITPADKGRATVLLNKEEYIQKMEAIVNDETKYRVVKCDPTTKTENKITDAMKGLRSQGYINDKMYDCLAPRYTNPPQLYGLPKVHKDGVPMRPIVSAIGSPCYNLAKELARILTPLAGHNGYSEKNSASFVQTVRETRITAMDHLVSFDVTNLFTQVSIDDALRVIEQKLSQDHSLLDRTAIPVPQLVELTELCLGSSYFQFQDKYYEQIEGAAMGSPLSPIVANLFMENLEEEAIRSSPLQPKLWRRYVDDTFVIWPHGQEELQRFHQHLNGIHPSIHFTMEEEKECTLPFLDVLVSRGHDKLLTSVYRKPTHTERYIRLSSHHPHKTITGVLRCMKDRADNICGPETRAEELRHLEDVFQANGFPATLVKKTLSAPPRVPRPPPSPTQPSQKTLCTPYVCGVSEKLKRICTRLNIRTVFTPAHTLKKTLMIVKNRVPEEKKKAVVYQVPCKDCHQLYTGESKRTLKVRLTEHRRAVQKE